MQEFFQDMIDGRALKECSQLTYFLWCAAGLLFGRLLFEVVRVQKKIGFWVVRNSVSGLGLLLKKGEPKFLVSVLIDFRECVKRGENPGAQTSIKRAIKLSELTDDQLDELSKTFTLNVGDLHFGIPGTDTLKNRCVNTLGENAIVDLLARRIEERYKNEIEENKRKILGLPGAQAIDSDGHWSDPTVGVPLGKIDISVGDNAGRTGVGSVGGPSGIGQTMVSGGGGGGLSSYRESPRPIKTTEPERKKLSEMEIGQCFKFGNLICRKMQKVTNKKGDQLPAAQIDECGNDGYIHYIWALLDFELMSDPAKDVPTNQPEKSSKPSTKLRNIKALEEFWLDGKKYKFCGMVTLSTGQMECVEQSEDSCERRHIYPDTWVVPV